MRRLAPSARRPMFLLLLLSLALPLGAQADPRDWDRKIAREETYEVGASGSVVLDVADADVVVRPGGSGKVNVQVEVASRDLERALERYEDMDFRFEQTGDRIRVRAREPRSHWHWRGASYSIVITVDLPEAFALDVSTGDGDIEVGAMRGSLRLQSGDGDIRLANANSPHVILDTQDGDIVLGEIQAPDVQIETSDGNVEAENLVGKDIDIRTSDGDIRIDRLAGGLNAHTNDGTIRVHIDALDATTLRSGDGDIMVSAPASLSANLDFRGEDVVLRQADLAFNGELGEHLVRGKLNGGGPRLQANTRDGRITLSTRP